MTLAFPNPSRSFDETRNAVRFMGHDGMSQIRFFIDAGALTKSDAARREADSVEDSCLTAFDAQRTTIYDVACRAYSYSRRDSYTLTADDFR